MSIGTAIRDEAPLGTEGLYHDASAAPIDAVITWVDGSDPAWRAKQRKFFDLDESDDAISSARYVQYGEIYRCVASILKYAPFINSIFIVTDGQDPDVPGYFLGHFGIDLTGRIHVVDHRDIFRDHLDMLPTFNSISIETLLHRIPGLSDRYIYFNDDFILSSPVAEADFFHGSRPVARGEFRSTLDVAAFRWAQRRRNAGQWAPFYKSFSFKDCQVRSAELLGLRGRYFWSDHTPHPFFKPIIADYLDRHPEILRHNIAFRTRDARQYSIAALSYCLNHLNDNIVLAGTDLTYMKLSAKRSQLSYLRRKQRSFARRRTRFLCMQALAEADAAARNLALEWLDRICFDGLTDHDAHSRN